MSLIVILGGLITLPALAISRNVGKSDSTILLQILGEVKKPGSYEVDSSDTILEIVTKAEPLETANLKEAGQAYLFPGQQELLVPRKGFLALFVEGAVISSTMIEINENLKWKEVVSAIETLEDADLVKLKRQKKMKNFGRIYVPKRAVKEK